jgi:farnesyl-diphosphate farnesyltransferase
LLHKSDGKELTPKDARTKAEEAEAKKDVFYLLLAVLGTLLFISALMVRLSNPFLDFSTDTPEIGAAWLAGARFDVAINELKKGKVFPKYGKGSPEAEAIVHQRDHGEL